MWRVTSESVNGMIGLGAEIEGYWTEMTVVGHQFFDMITKFDAIVSSRPGNKNSGQHRAVKSGCGVYNAGPLKIGTMRRKNIRLSDNTIVTPGTLVYFKAKFGKAAKGELGRVSKILEHETHIDSLRGYITVVPDAEIGVVGSVRTDIYRIRVIPDEDDP